MAQKRFYFISKYLCFYDHTEQPCRDRLYKFCVIFNLFKAKIGSAFEPYNHLTVDEQLYPFRGNFRSRQYMPNKPAKYGIKYWCLADVRTSYLCNVDVYLGRDTSRNHPLGESV